VTRRLTKLMAVCVVVLAACAAEPASGDLPAFEPDEFSARLEQSERPTVVNVWGSWCVPCRTEAPLLAAAHERHAARVDFVGVAVEDTRSGAQGFIDEFGLAFPQLFDPTGEVREIMGGGVGAPVTYFVAPGGEVVDTHFGVLDEDRLAGGIDRLLTG
jgi:cytochrome c biogenesis protein CcmG, thiol:disulfide interchange protein DsbE